MGRMRPSATGDWCEGAGSTRFNLIPLILTFSLREKELLRWFPEGEGSGIPIGDCDNPASPMGQSDRSNSRI